VELDFNSVERIVEYLDVPQEAPLIMEKRPPAYWPSSNGGVEIENLVIRYSENLPAVLKSISFSVLPREKIGIVSRTQTL
jgi:ABC-type multidrug transport system fused ATPase/permease subunit